LGAETWILRDEKTHQLDHEVIDAFERLSAGHPALTEALEHAAREYSFVRGVILKQDGNWAPTGLNAICGRRLPKSTKSPEDCSSNIACRFWCVMPGGKRFRVFVLFVRRGDHHCGASGDCELRCLGPAGQSAAGQVPLFIRLSNASVISLAELG